MSTASSNKGEIINAKVKSTHLGMEDHGIFTAMIHLEWDHAGQGFGGYMLDTYNKEKDKRVGTEYGMEFIRRLLETLELEKWEDLPGTFVRIEQTHTKILRIGHLLKDKWFDPDVLGKEYYPDAH